ncbi:hypothetical protein MPLSOD_280024 [Mesorhizobium sp. SOD10]|nr:hypothetical protein MPLSOD_280024 [Mesorhizobium sp. SOD10]
MGFGWQLHGQLGPISGPTVPRWGCVGCFHQHGFQAVVNARKFAPIWINVTSKRIQRDIWTSVGVKARTLRP